MIKEQWIEGACREGHDSITFRMLSPIVSLLGGHEMNDDPLWNQTA